MRADGSAVRLLLRVLLDSPRKEANQLAVDPARQRATRDPTAGRGWRRLGVCSRPALGPGPQGQLRGAE